MANITFARNPGLLGCTPELMGGPVFDAAANALPYSGSVSRNTRDKISRLLRELLSLETRVAGRPFSELQPILTRLSQIRGYFYELGSDAEPRRSATLDGIQVMYEMIGDEWYNMVSSYISGIEVQAAAMTNPHDLQALLEEVDAYINKAANVDAQIKDTPSVKRGLRELNSLRNRIYGEMYASTGKEDPTGSSSAGRLPDRKMKFPGWNDGDDDKKEEEGMGLALPLALAAGGVGLLLALRG